MQTKETKQFNITLLFSEPLNHLLITPSKILDLFKKTEDKKSPQHTLVEAPGLKVFVFPQLQKEVVFEVNRLLINDKSGLLPDKSELINYLAKITKSEMVDKKKIIAYGLNYDILITTVNESIDFVKFVGSKISKVVENIEKAGIQIAFHKQTNSYNLELKPINQNKLIAHLNVHYNTPLPSKKNLQENLVKQFNYFIALIEKF